LAWIRSDAGLAAYVGKSAVAIVMEEVARCRFEKTRDAIVTAILTLVRAVNILRLIKENETRNEQIQFAIVVIVKPDSMRGPSGRRDSCFVCDIAERAIAVIVIENVAPVTRHIEIHPTI